jgi:hypothetical protein
VPTGTIALIRARHRHGPAVEPDPELPSSCSTSTSRRRDDGHRHGVHARRQRSGLHS